MSDDDDTPTFRKRRVQTSADRDTQSQPRRRRPQEYPVQHVPDDDCEELTSPHDLLDRPTTPAQKEMIRRSRRESDSPVTYEDLIKLADSLTRERSETRQRQRDLEAILRGPHEAIAKVQGEVVELRKEVTDMRKTVDPVGKLLTVALSGLGAVAITIGIFLYTRGNTEGAAAEHARQQDATITEMKAEIRRLSRSKDTP